MSTAPYADSPASGPVISRPGQAGEGDDPVLRLLLNLKKQWFIITKHIYGATLPV